MPRGGKRSNAGRKPRPRPETSRTGKDVAGDVLGSIDQFAYWRFLLHADEDLRTLDAARRQEVERNITYLTNRAHGKPVEAIVTDNGGLEKLAERLQAARNRK